MRSFYPDRLGTNIGKALKMRPVSAGGVGEKNVLFEPFIYKNDHFTKTGSGQT